jgi:hypothetical protein
MSLPGLVSLAAVAEFVLFRMLQPLLRMAPTLLPGWLQGGLLSVGTFAAHFAGVLALSSLLALLFLGCAAPWPSRGRTAIELRGYAMTIAVEMWATGGIRQERLAEIERQFTGWAYYRMWPETGDVRERLLAIARQVDTGEILKGPGSEPYQDVHRVLDAAGRLAEGR